MKILAIETSGDWCSVALWRDGVIFERDMRAQQRQSGHVIDLAHDLLNAQGECLQGMDGFAFGAGPGAFTGLRIACGVVQGFALGADKPVVGVSTLLALAQGSSAARAICCIDARMNEVYHAAYEKHGGDWSVVCEPGVCAAQDVPALPGGSWQGCGNGFAVYPDILRARYGEQVTLVHDALYPRARDIAALALPRFVRGEGVAAEHAVPHYVRDRVALKMSER